LSTTLSSFEMASLVANLAEDKKAKDTLILMTEQVSSLTDYFVVASVESRSQMFSLAEHITKTLKQYRVKAIGQELDKGGRWTLLDFGDVIIHLFHQEDRTFYNLERFWTHATEIPKDQWLELRRQAS
jgi:ribosome-associated protein